MKKQIFKGLALGLLVAVTIAPLHAQTTGSTEQRTEPAAMAQSTGSTDQPTEPAVGEELGYGFSSVVANLFYMPAKVTYAGLGLLTGGLGFVLSGGRADVANNIIYPAVKGNYVVTPSHLKGSEPLYFVGAPPAENAPPASAPVAAAPTTSAATATR